MSTPERRKYSRVRVYYPISYVCMDKNDCVVQQNMGVALNISQSGILIETADSVFSKYITLISVDLKENIIEIKGKVSYCKRNKSGKYRTGISFKGTHAQSIHFVKGLIRAYHYNRNEYRYSCASESKTAVM
jgi:c-di-GMP-binding flagellar brake protein YcgR